MGQLPEEDIQINLEAYTGTRKRMMARLLEIHEEGKEEDGTSEGAMVVTYEGYICGVPEFFTTDATVAFRFMNREQAVSFITEFGDVLLNPQVLDHR